MIPNILSNCPSDIIDHRMLRGDDGLTDSNP